MEKTEQSPLTEADSKSISDIMMTDPEFVTDADLDKIIDYYTGRFAEYQAAVKAGKKPPKEKVKIAPGQKIDLGDLDL